MSIFKRYDDRETLERIKRWPVLMNRFLNVRIFSAEHNAYWRKTGQGYTENENESAIWNMKRAYKRTCHCGPEKQIQFVKALTEEQS